MQKTFFASKDVLYKRFRVLYPGDQESHAVLQAAFSSQPTLSVCLQGLGLTDIGQTLAYLRDYRNRLLQEIAETRPRRIIISSEYFSALSVVDLRALWAFLAPLATKRTPVLYVRDPWSFSISLIQELIRSGQLKDRVNMGYTRSNVELIEKFEAAFCMPIQVVPYGSPSGKFDIVSDFFSRFGIPSDVIPESSQARENAGMSREAAIALLQCNLLFPVYKEDGTHIPSATRDWMIQSIIDAPYEGSRIDLSTEQAEEIQEQSRADLEIIQYRHLGGDPILSDQYKNIRPNNTAGDLAPENIQAPAIYRHLLTAMHKLAEMASTQYTERLYWSAMYFLAVNNPGAASDCFKSLVDFPGPHARRSEAETHLRALQTPGNEHSAASIQRNA